MFAKLSEYGKPRHKQGCGAGAAFFPEPESLPGGSAPAPVLVRTKQDDNMRISSKLLIR